ncbi:MAG: LysR family transcriptional regulator [Flavobacteriales bacterium]|nr:MAG: LysR family transcriptional regulator [Flavobacteriales bacterium]
MTITQLEYILAVAEHRHFGKAAEACGVTQPTLSMQIQKLEEAWRTTLFDRSRKPIELTKTGYQVVEQAKNIVKEVRKMDDILDLSRGKFHGVLRIGIIPTVSPYLLHRIFPLFTKRFPNVFCVFTENTTDNLIKQVRNDEIDVAILATPLDETGTIEKPLYYEPFVAFVHAGHRLAKESFILNSELDLDDLLLLSEGHCFRNSVLQMCQAKGSRISTEGSKVMLESGNFETLYKLVKNQVGMTLLPYLMAIDLSESDRKWIRPIAEPRPVREIGLLYSRTQLRTSLIDALGEIISSSVPEKLLKPEGKVYSPK